MLSHFSRVRLCATPLTAAHQAPPSLGFSRQEHWSGLPFPSPMHESEKWKVKVKLLSCVRLLATSWIAASQAPPSTGFSKQEYWSGVPLPSPKSSHRWYRNKSARIYCNRTFFYGHWNLNLIKPTHVTKYYCFDFFPQPLNYIKSPEINLHIYDQLIFNWFSTRVPRPFDGERVTFSTNGAEKKISTGKKWSWTT